MIYVLGGASRSGKTLLARKAVEEKQIPYIPLDALFEGLVQGAPQLGMTWDQSFVERGEKLWPISKSMITHVADEERNFLIEGDSILPKQISELVQGGTAIKSCFLGYSKLTKEEKLSLIRQYHQGDTDWTKDISDEEMFTYIQHMIDFSTYLEEECKKYDIPYFDISDDFETPREQAFTYLFAD